MLVMGRLWTSQHLVFCSRFPGGIPLDCVGGSDFCGPGRVKKNVTKTLQKKVSLFFIIQSVTHQACIGEHREGGPD